MKRYKRVIRTERIWLKSNPNIRFFCHLSKNLYNEANYLVRQEFFNQKKRITAWELEQHLNNSPNYLELPLTTARKVLQLVELAWKAFFASSKDYFRNPEKYFKRPSLPRYKKKTGEFLLSFKRNDIEFTNGVISSKYITELCVQTRLLEKTPIIGVRIMPKGIGYVLEILYLKDVPLPLNQNPQRITGIDIGLTNLITMVNNIGVKPIIMKGGVVKSINQYYNKEKARLQGIYSRQGFYTSKKLQRLKIKRQKKIENYFHEASRSLISWCQINQIDTIIVGYNKQWKTHSNLGKRLNQNFTNISFESLLHKLEYKGQDVGIRVIRVSEYYTSKCSFLDQEPIKRRSSYLGERISRGLFQTHSRTIINSDVNGAYNILKKAVPNAFSMNETADGIEGVWLHPVRSKLAMVTN